MMDGERRIGVERSDDHFSYHSPHSTLLACPVVCDLARLILMGGSSDVGVKELTGLRADDQVQTLPEPPDLEGYLDKLKHKTTILGSWNRRFFVVDAASRALVYYHSKQAHQQGAEPSGRQRSLFFGDSSGLVCHDQ